MFELPRVSRDQCAGTRSRLVPKEALLPGDLVFFSSNGTASGIHHVGMYIGDGKMVHSPNSREQVKVSTVWWSRFFAATRIYGAVSAPTTPPATTAPPTTKPPTTPPTTRPTTPAGEPSASASATNTTDPGTPAASQG